MDIAASANSVYDRILDAESEEWTLETACGMHQQFASCRMWPRHLASAWDFLGDSLSMSPHSCSLVFEDNHLALLKNTFHVLDGEAEFGVARLSLIVAISGGAKSILLGFVEGVLKSQEVTQAFSLAEDASIKNLGKFTWYSSQGSNLEGLIAHAKKANDPIGLRTIHEEVGHTICKLGKNEKDKLLPTQVSPLLLCHFCTVHLNFCCFLRAILCFVFVRSSILRTRPWPSASGSAVIRVVFPI